MVPTFRSLSVAKIDLTAPPVRHPDVVGRLVSLNADHHRRMAADAALREAVAAQGGPREQARIAAGDHASRDALLEAMRGAVGRFGFDRTGDRTVLEIGAGHGGDAGALRAWLHAEYVGIEVVPDVAAASGVLNLALEECPEDWNGKFDWIYSRHVMEHVPDVDLALSTVKRLLAPGGVVGAVTPHYFPDPEPAHVTQLRLGAWMEAYRRHGLTPVYAVEATYVCAEAHLVLAHADDVHGKF